jgi:maltooligosyltrehalose trehalohydrolase
VRRFLCDNAIMWLRDYHFDGLRLDAVHALIDTSATHFLEQLSEEVDALEAVTGRHLVLVAESDLNDPRVIRAREAGGFGMDAQWSDDFHHSLHSVLTGEHSGYYKDFGSLTQLSTALQRGFVYAGERSPYRSRAHGREPHEIPGWRFVVAAQTHDQIGNRAAGERLSHLVSPARQKIAAALLLTSPFVPLLFQGEEWGASSPFQYFTAHEDPNLADMVSEGRKREFAEFGWRSDSVPDPQAPDTFERSCLRWHELTSPEHAELHRWYQSLITVRRQAPALSSGRLTDVGVDIDESASTVMIRRDTALVVVNLGASTCVMDAPDAHRILLSSSAEVALGAGTIELPADSVAIVERNPLTGAAMSR